MSGNLLDRLISPQALSWRFAVHVVLVTLAFHTCAWLLYAIAEPPAPSEFGYLILLIGWPIPSYWAIFFLAALSDPTDSMHRWRVWVSWLVVSYPFAGAYLMMLFGRRDAVEGIAFLPIILIPFSPVIALVGAVAGQLLWYLYQLLKSALRKVRRQHAD